MHSSIHRPPRAVAASIVVFLSMVSSASAETIGRPAAAVDRSAFRCQQAVTSADHAFVVLQLADLGRCAAASLSCAETAPDDAECLPAARERCERTVARILRRHDRLAHRVEMRCRGVDPEVLLAPTGLGFARLAPVCPALGTEHGDAAVLGTCLAGFDRCRGERLFAAVFPRSGELLRVAGVSASTRAALACLPDRGGSGRGERDADAGAVVTRCARSTARAAARLTGRTLANASKCTRTAWACLVPDGDAPVDREECLTAATETCGGAFRRIDDARRAFGRAVVAACGAARIDFDALAAPRGANLEALDDVCAGLQVDIVADAADAAECLARYHDCELADAVRQATPRADELFAMVGQTLEHPYCAAPAPTASMTPAETPLPPPTPTATTTGPTRTPRPGETATPTPRATPTVSRTPAPEPSATPFCGNGKIDDGEECDGDVAGLDGAGLDDNDCEGLCFESDPLGKLACFPNCTFDFRDCRGEDCEAP